MSNPLPPQQPVGYSGLYPTLDTQWSVSNGVISVALVTSGVAGTPVPFTFKGVRYQPTPIDVDSNAAGSPMGDFFYIGAGQNDATMIFYDPIWERDVGPNGLLRTLGVNNLGVYGTFNIPPFTMSNADGGGTLVPSAGNTQIDWTALGPIRYVGTNPAYMPVGASAKQSPPYWYHFCHDRFLDLCWNDGVNPIYVFLAVGVSPQAFFSVNPAPAQGYQYTQVQQYYLDSAAWMAQSYGHHPALAGFYVTNETNQPGPTGTFMYREYWDFLNQVGATLKQYAPGKLTIAAMQDDISTLTTQLVQYVTPPTPGQNPPPATQLLYVEPGGTLTTTATGNSPAYAPNDYTLDLLGWNLYAAANTQTPIISYLMNAKANGQAFVPVVLSEIGIPQAMRFTSVAGVPYGPQGGNDPYFVNPNGYQAIWANNALTVSIYPNSYNNAMLGEESLAVVTTTSTARTASNFFTLNPTYNAGGLVAYESDTTNYWLFQGNPTGPTWVQINAPQNQSALDALRTSRAPAAGPSFILGAYLDAAYSFQIGNAAAPAANQVLSGVQVFEYCDEWYKWVDPSIANTPTEATAAGVHDFRDASIAPWGPANAQFYTCWEEEWFGLCSALPNGRSSTSPAINQYGWMAGNGADLLTQRASFNVVQAFFAQQS